MFQVDSETLNDLTQVYDTLAKFLQWLIKRKDLEATGKLMPIVKVMSSLLAGIVEGNIPEAAATFDVINRMADEMNERLAQAKTPEEFEKLSNEADKVCEMVQKMLDDHLAEINKLEQTGKKEQKH